jgi:hypothetical protein
MSMTLDPEQELRDQFALLSAYYVDAYKLPGPVPRELEQAAVLRWRQRGEQTNWSAIISVLETLDAWREARDQARPRGKQAA